jgi:predicted acetyltransferase
MAIEYRTLREEERAGALYMSTIAFGDSTADDRLQRALERSFVKPEWTLAAIEGGTVVSRVVTLPWEIGWNRGTVGCGAVTGVGTLPSHRRQGHLYQLMTRAFQTMRESNQPVALLWASMAAIYQRFGYGIGFTGYRSDIDPRHVRYVDEIPTPGKIRMVKYEHANPVLKPVYDAFAAPRTLMARRSDWWWDALLRMPPPDQAPPLVAVYEENGESVGHVVYSIDQRRRETPGPSQQITVWEFCWLTPSAHRALVQYLVGYDLVDSVRFARLPVDDPLFHHVHEPRLLNMTVWDGTLLRVVDVAPALMARGYDADGRLTFALEDGMCPWNTGVWELTVEGGCGRVKPGSGAPDLELSSRALAIIACGHQPASVLARGGLITASDEKALARADALFATAYAPYTIDGF